MPTSSKSQLRLGAVIAALCFGSGLQAAPPGAVPHDASLTALSSPSISRQAALRPHANTLPADAQGRYSVIVRFNEEAVAAYAGGLPGLAATSPRARGERKLDLQSSPARAYTAFLRGKHDDYLSVIGKQIGRQVRPELQFFNAYNGLTLRLSLAEAAAVAELAFVRDIQLDDVREVTTDVGPGWIGAPAVWNGDTNSGLPNKGEGILIGVIDSGFNHDHPSFAAVASDGYVHVNPFGAGTYLGVCTTTPSLCNDKLVGAYDFHPSALGPEDNAGHGTHVASTAAGNPVNASFSGLSIPISGVAPRANLINYKVCEPTCPGSSSIAAVNQAIADGVDVLNYSISGSDFPWNDPVDIAFLDAFNAGVFVSASAGNSGPGASTVAKTGPWNAAVANSTHNRVVGNRVDAAGLTSLLGLPGSGPALGADLTAPILDAATVAPSNALGCSAFPAGSFAGAFALIQRGTCGFADKVANATNAGAVGVLMFNNAGGPPIVMGALESSTIPSVMLDQASGLAVRAAITPGAQATLYAGSSSITNPAWGDVMSNTSSRGPSQYDLIKPDYAAPGTNILAAYVDSAGGYAAISGTSMASPHGAGAAALLIKENPGWSPAAIKSALALTAQPNMLKENGLTPADAFDRGSGRIALADAATIGFVMDETHANFVAANPAAGGDPRTLNLPSYMNRECVGGCSFSRSITSVQPTAQDYEVSATTPAGVTVSVSPSSFTLAAGETRTLDVTITVNTATAALDTWNFGSIEIRPATTTHVAEGFESATFPPTGWTVHNLDAAAPNWARSTTVAATGTASARHSFGSAGTDQNGWLVTPQVALQYAPSLRFADRTQFPTFYAGHELYASTGSCDPVAGDFALVGETGNGGDAWRTLTYDLSAYANQSVCFGFRYTGDDADAWAIDNVVLTSSPQLSPPPVHRLPLAIVPRSPTPTIEVDPASMAVTVDEGAAAATRSLTVRNTGAVDLNWSRSTAPARGGAVFEQGNAALTAGIVSGFFTTSPANTGAYSADDFTLTAPTQVSGLFFDGFFSAGGSLAANASAIRFYVYPDAGGKPAGNPEDGQNAHVWSAVVPIGSAGLSVVDSTIDYDLTAAGQPSISLAAGTYWVVAAPVVASTSSRWNWFAADSGVSGAEAQIITPGSAFGGAFPSWTSIVAGLGDAQYAGLAFRLDQTVDCDAPWLSIDPTSGTVAADGSTQLDVTFDPDGLVPGTYSGAVCLASNDPETPIAVVPVTFEVAPVPEIATDLAAIDAGPTVRLDSTTVDLEISNIRDGSLDWSFDVPPAAAKQWDNGPLVNYPGMGPGGSDYSALQSSTLGMNTLGASIGGAFRMADDFQVTGPDGLTLTKLRFFGYQTGSSTTSSFTGVNLRIWNGNPSNPASQVVYGDTSTNRIAGTGFTNAYRVSETAVGTTRPIMWIDAAVNVTLPPGTYWVDFKLAGSIASGPWVPAVTINGQAATGDGLQFNGTTWTPFLDTGTGTPPQGVPFEVHGASGGACDLPADLDWLSIAPSSSSTAGGTSTTATFTFDATDAAVGTHTAELCLTSNARNTPVVRVPVSFEVVAPTVSIDQASLPAGTVGAAYSATLSASGAGSIAPFAFSWTGSAPAGLSLAADGTVSGTPTAAGSYAVTVSATDATAAALGGPFSGTRAFTIQIDAATQSIDFPAIADTSLVDSPVSVSATASSGLAVSFSSDTPAVCDVAAGEVSLLTVGSCSIRAAQAGNDDYLPADDVVRTFQVLPADVVVSPGTLAAAVIDDGYSVQFSASGAGTTAPYTFAVTAGSLPDGLTLSPSGLLSGVPTTVGSATFTVEATDSTPGAGSGPFTGSREYTLEVIESFVFLDGFESDAPLLSLDLQKTGRSQVAVPVADLLSQAADGQVQPIAQLLLKTRRVALVEGRCSAAACEIRVVSKRPGQGWSAGEWMAVHSDPLSLSVDLADDLSLSAGIVQH